MNPQNNRASLHGKKVVLLGASSGIGLATAKAAAAEGAEVVIVSGNSKRINGALQQLPPTASCHTVDLSNETAIQQFFSTIGVFDHLVYTAGENLVLHEIKNTDIEASKQFFSVRIWGALAAVKYAAPNINKGGSISLMSGIASARPGKGWGIASAICGAMEGFTRAMAVELAPIRVNCVVPGVIQTNLWGSMPEADRNNLFAVTAAALPVQRAGEAEDVAQAYLYLMQQKYGTGLALTVDGGAVLV